MLSRTKDRLPVDSSIIDTLPARKLVDSAPPSTTPCCITLCLNTRSSTNCTAPSIEGWS